MLIDPVAEPQPALVIRHHYQRYGGDRFCHRGEVVERLGTISFLSPCILVAKSLTVDHIPVLGNQHLTAGVSTRTKSLLGNAIDPCEDMPIQVHILGQGGREASLGGGETGAVGEKGRPIIQQRPSEGDPTHQRIRQRRHPRLALIREGYRICRYDGVGIVIVGGAVHEEQDTPLLTEERVHPLRQGTISVMDRHDQ